MRILILGAGGLGGYFGGRLFQSGVDVTFLVRPARAALLRDKGLVIKGPSGDARLRVPVVTAEDAAAAGPYDLVMLTCKSYDLDSAVEAIRPAADATAFILPFLNGISHLDRLDAVFGKARVLGGLAYVSTTIGPAGEIVQLNDMQTLVIGARDPAQAALCAVAAKMLETAPFPAKVSPGIMQEIWEKFAFLATLAGITCLMRGNIGAISETRDGAAVTRRMLEEAEAVSAAAGYPVRDAAKEKSRQLLIAPGSPFTSSMLRDLEKGMTTEAAHIVGDLARRGKESGIDVPLLSAAFAHLEVYEAKRPEASGTA